MEKIVIKFGKKHGKKHGKNIKILLKKKKKKSVSIIGKVIRIFLGNKAKAS